MELDSYRQVLLFLTAFFGLVLFGEPAFGEEEDPPTPEAVTGTKAAPSDEPDPSPNPPANVEDEEEAEKERKQALKWALEAYISEDLRYRNAGGEDDLHSYTQIYADATHRGERAYHVRFNGRLILNLIENQNPASTLRDYWDGFDHQIQFRLYEAYGDVPFKSALVRVGRQFLDEGNYFHVDGVRVDVDLSEMMKGLDLTVIGGVPVRLSGTSRDSNWMIGVVARARVSKDTRLRLSYYHVSESFPGINSPVVDPINQPVTIPAGDIDDDLVGLSAWHNFMRTLRVYGRFTVLNGDANELHLRLRWFTEDGKWNVVAEWYQLFERLHNVTNDLSPYAPMLGSYQPFWRIGLRGTYRPSPLWVLAVGLSRRQVENTSNEGVFNHTYTHYSVSATRVDAWKPGLDVSVTVNGYVTSDSREFLATTTTLVYRINPEVRVTGGIDYSLYKYLWFNNSEHENVWTYFVRVRWEARKKVTVSGMVSVDDGRNYTWTTLAVRLTWRF